MSVSRWRLAAGGAVLVVLAFLGLRLTPVYIRNFQLQRFVNDVSHRPGAAASSDDVVRTWVLDESATLDLPVKPGDIRINRTSGGVQIAVRYAARVDLPLYTVNLHLRAP